jgi:hypothetical protein
VNAAARSSDGRLGEPIPGRGREIRANRRRRLRARRNLTNELRAAIRENKPAILAELADAAHYRWRVILPDGTPRKVCALPELTEAEMLESLSGDDGGAAAGCVNPEVALAVEVGYASN